MPAGSSGRTRAEWWESPAVVLPLLFVVLGPLALPLLWRSRRFTWPWKIALSAVVLAIAAYTVWQVWYALHQWLAPIWDVEKSLRL
jgi:formate hydrogenlyase subunit 3/multisubunit Na+/H+ antiporter MnhD subunit